MVSISPDVKEPIAAEFSPAVIRGGEVIGSLTFGAIGGYFVYGLTCLVKRAGMIDKEVVLQPIPYVLSGIVSASIVETARLIYDAAFYTLGERQKYENLANPIEASTFDHFRQKTWTVIKCTEGLLKNVDSVYSRIFNIRTENQIRADFATEKDYYLKGDPRLMEVFRRAFLVQVDETIKTSIPQELSIYAVEAMGFTIFGGHLFVWLYAVMFVNGLMHKIGGTFEKIDEEQLKECKRIHENKVTCDLLAALYPYEMAKMEAALAGISHKLSKNSNDLSCDLHRKSLSPYGLDKGVKRILDTSSTTSRPTSSTFCDGFADLEQEKMEEEELVLTDVEYVSDDDVSSDEGDEIPNQFDSAESRRTAQLNFTCQQLDVYKFKTLTKFLNSSLPTKFRNYKNTFDYCRSTYPIKGFPFKKIQFDKEGKEIKCDDVGYIEIKKEDLPKNFALFDLEEVV